MEKFNKPLKVESCNVLKVVCNYKILYEIPYGHLYIESGATKVYFLS